MAENNNLFGRQLALRVAMLIENHLQKTTTTTITAICDDLISNYWCSPRKPTEADKSNLRSRVYDCVNQMRQDNTVSAHLQNTSSHLPLLIITAFNKPQ